MRSQQIDYQLQGKRYQGYLAYDETISGKRPVVLVAHDWSGRNEFACKKAELLAELGYVGFAVDLYGDGRIGATNEEKSQLMKPLMEDRQHLRACLDAAIATVKTLEPVDASAIAAIGFCFGGLCVLELARSGVAVKGVVSFHGLLGRDPNLPQTKILSKILALHGHDDPMVPPEQVSAFEQEMTQAGADWQLVVYGHTLHAFMNPLANDPAFGTVYNACVEKRAWLAMKNFLHEIFNA